MRVSEGVSGKEELHSNSNRKVLGELILISLKELEENQNGEQWKGQ